MVVITDITIPADQFALGELFEEYPDIDIELERLVPLREGVIPLFWVEVASPEAVETTLLADPMTLEVTLLTDMDGRHLFNVVWDAAIDSLVQPLIESNAEVLRAEGGADYWEFRLQFESRDQLADFRRRCQENDVQIQLDALYNPALPDQDTDGSGLTDEQYDLIATAYDNGYFEVPRGIELGEVATLIGISSNAASQRMRRGLSTIVEWALEAQKYPDRK
ncbi:helix-turn-helix domain-containing protein [Halomarina rubra]|uniref:Helix-turn-helix domain-containing protein n=1 Tax=Halomarina rubra TaxID=2071873 RepID=A0ABD6ASP1_9EURY|nr:helix-turn-helix domain-containing protein [Halomarina rubra]